MGRQIATPDPTDWKTVSTAEQERREWKQDSSFRTTIASSMCLPPPEKVVVSATEVDPTRPVLNRTFVSLSHPKERGRDATVAQKEDAERMSFERPSQEKGDGSGMGQTRRGEVHLWGGGIQRRRDTKTTFLRPKETQKRSLFLSVKKKMGTL